MKKILLAITLLLGISLSSFAQSDIDAYLFSQSNYEGTARFMGAGGAFGAVGADFSSLNINPAGIALYKRSEISFTPMVVSIYNDNTIYNGTGSNTSNAKYAISNVGGVFRFELTKDNWKSVHFGFGYNRTNDFNNIYRVEGYSNNTSLMNQLVSESNALGSVSPATDAWLAYQTWLIDQDPISGIYDSPYRNKSLYQKRIIETRGGNDELNISLGGNYNDKLFIGATIGVPVLSYTEIDRYSEASDQAYGGIRNYQTYGKLTVKSTGINLKLGIIYQPVDFIRIGASFHTPTYFGKVNDNYYKEMTSYYWDGENSGTYSYTNVFKYTLKTPLRAIGSVAFLIKKRAFISAEYEYTNYGMAKMSSNDYSFSEENENIDDKYGSCHKVRVGGEVYVTNSFLLRAGYNYKTSGFKSTVNNNDACHTASAGIGFRTKYLFIDFAYVFNSYNEKYWLYSPAYINESASHDRKIHRIVATIGCKF